MFLILLTLAAIACVASVLLTGLILSKLKEWGDKNNKGGNPFGF